MVESLATKVAVFIMAIFGLTTCTKWYQYKLIHSNYQFSEFSPIRKFQVTSLEECSAQCQDTGSVCKSFSFNSSKICTLSLLPLLSEVNYPDSLFDVEEGTLMFARLSSDEQPSSNIFMLNTTDYTYLLSLTTVTWFQARELCMFYGDGFYLADVNGTEELGILFNWLESLSLEKKYLGRYNGPYVSGTDMNHEKCWVWTTPLISHMSNKENWSSGQPDNYQRGEHCARINGKGKFNDGGCEYKSAYICKRPHIDNEYVHPKLQEAFDTDLC